MTLIQSAGADISGKYQQQEIYKHDDDRYVTIGVIEGEENQTLLLTGWRNIEDSWKREVDMLLTMEGLSPQVNPKVSEDLDKRRGEWVELAMNHKPEKHVAALYTDDTIYLANGRKSVGYEEVAKRYYYMKNPNYKIALKKTDLWNIDEKHILETGRYFVGGDFSKDGGVYVVIWEQVDSGEWRLTFDFNF